MYFYVNTNYAATATASSIPVFQCCEASSLAAVVKGTNQLCHAYNDVIISD